MNNKIARLSLMAMMIAVTGMMGITFDLAFAQSNSPPVLSIAKPSESGVYDNQHSIEFWAGAQDSEDGNIRDLIEWSSNIDGPLFTGNRLSVLLSAGEHTITVHVTDSGGLSDTETLSLTVLDAINNTRPTISISSPASASEFLQGAPVTFAGSAIDGEEGDLSSNIFWESSIDGIIHLGDSFTTSSLSIGSHAITAEIADALGLSNSVTILVIVLDPDNLPPNNPPTLFITSPSHGSSFDEGNSVVLTGTSDDLQDGVISSSIEWSSDVDEFLGVGSSLTVTSLSAGIHDITASVTDSGGLTTTVTISITINEVALPGFPTVSIISPVSGLEINEGAWQTFLGSASDVEDGTLSSSIQWSSSIDGSLVTGSSFGTLSLSGGVHTITATVTDSNNNQDSEQITLTVISEGGTNTPPTVSTISPSSGSQIPQGNPVLFTASAMDPQDGDISSQVQWTSSLDNIIGNGASFSTSTLSVGSHIITAIVTDTGGLSDSNNIILVVIDSTNTPPTVTIISPTSGSEFTEGDSISFSGNAIDNEDGNISSSLQWTSDLDGLIENGTSFSNSTLSVGTHAITAFVTDSGGANDSKQIPITINGIQSCSPSVSGDWTITSSCILSEITFMNGNVIVQNNSVLEIPNGVTLDIDFANFNLTVKSGSGVLIKLGGAIT